MRYAKYLAALLVPLILCTACKKQDFNPYKHMSQLVTITTAEQFEHDREQLLAHIDPELHSEIIGYLTDTIYDEYYSITEKNVYIEEQADCVKLIADYECNSSLGRYNQVVYYVYEDGMLVDYRIYTVDPVINDF